MKSATGGPLIEHVHEGMTVMDMNGDKIGDVEAVRMGDPGAATTKGNDVDDPGLLGNVAEVFAGDERAPDVPDPLRDQLLRTGFIKVDGPGLTDTDRYMRADLVASVSDDTVTLTVSKDHLPRES